MAEFRQHHVSVFPFWDEEFSSDSDLNFDETSDISLTLSSNDIQKEVVESLEDHQGTFFFLFFETNFPLHVSKFSIFFF